MDVLVIRALLFGVNIRALDFEVPCLHQLIRNQAPFGWDSLLRSPAPDIFMLLCLVPKLRFQSGRWEFPTNEGPFGESLEQASSTYWLGSILEAPIYGNLQISMADTPDTTQHDPGLSAGRLTRKGAGPVALPCS